MTEANRWASNIDITVDEILRCLGDVQRILNNITVTNAPATFITSACAQQLGADNGCFRNVRLSNDSSQGALLTASNNFTVAALSLYPPLGPTALRIDSTAVRRETSDFMATTNGYGFVMADGTPHYWRLAMSTDGIPYFHDTGATAP